MKRQLFIFDVAMLDVMQPEEVQATYNDMKELKIHRAPYDEFTIQLPYGPTFFRILMKDEDDQKKMDPKLNVPLRIMYNLTDWDGESARVDVRLFLLHEQTGKWYDYLEYIKERRKDMEPKGQQILTDTAMHASAYYLTYLVVLLATKNVVRHVSHNRLARLGRGKQDYEYVTTLKIGQLIEDDGLPHQHTGMTKRPHLRRGHIRRQHYGPSNTYIKKVFVAPIFVNGWMPDAHDDRQAYNVSLSRKG